jgi:hypothetical protein
MTQIDVEAKWGYGDIAVKTRWYYHTTHDQDEVEEEVYRRLSCKFMRRSP